TWGYNVTDEEYEAIGQGDFLFFDYVHPRVKAARDRGAFTVGVKIPFIPSRTTPKGVLSTLPRYRQYGRLLTEECSDLVLTSGVPFTEGVLHIPEIPAVRACAMSVQGVGMFYWMLSAEIAVRDKGGEMGGSEKALEYIELVKERGARIRGDLDQIDAAAQAMVECVKNGGRYWTHSYGCKMDSEIYGRASGLAMVQLIRSENMEEKAKPGDFAVIAGEFSDVKENVEMARALKSIGVKVIAVGPA
ncbi:unnamed protein product, partial [marine sediment metagenome]